MRTRDVDLGSTAARGRTPFVTTTTASGETPSSEQSCDRDSCETAMKRRTRRYIGPSIRIWMRL